eukprot:CAMPEP_0171133382 /NCGR_PEP_ID=MMETSP0766_2-20121228/126195_1 /TAXON_ID=439317 /ORGANISM="Gambierdiscus australes, Strain CAWD 149" /LENGTH=91 /DNA_ID=CAMNT_0011596757 /DNA_START=81 /DNA_END=353 /DNA_ORIENTATION=+
MAARALPAGSAQIDSNASSLSSTKCVSPSDAAMGPFPCGPDTSGQKCTWRSSRPVQLHTSMVSKSQVSESVRMGPPTFDTTNTASAPRRTT